MLGKRRFPTTITILCARRFHGDPVLAFLQAFGEVASTALVKGNVCA
jgi:hypothetical protein